MLNELLTLGVGALVGSLLTRQYDDLKVRRSDSDLLRHVYHEINDFECALLSIPPKSGLLGQIVTHSSFDELQRPSNESLRLFLKTKLCLVLPSEVRAELKDVADTIDEFNELAAKRNPKAFDFGEHYIYLEFPQRLAITSIAYTASARYWLLGKAPDEDSIIRKFAPGECGELKSKLGL